MAMVRFNTGKVMFMPPEKAANIWLCINGYLPYMNEAQKKFARRVKKIYLNPSNAPKEYLAARRKENDKQTELVPQVRLPYND